LEACFEAALAHFRDHGGAGRKAERDLARDERTFIKFLNSPAPPPHEAIERVYDRLLRCEEAFGSTDGKATRLERLRLEFDSYLRRRAVDAAVKKVAMARAAAATERDSPWEPVAPAPGLTPSQNNRSDGGAATPVAVETPEDVVQRAREISEAVKRAGQYAGAARRGERLCWVLP
jgi:hypothetical protein